MSSKAVLLSLCLIVIGLSGCANDIQVVRAPFVSPVVVPAPDRFLMNAVVKNGSSQQQGGWKLFVYTEYGPPGQFNNNDQRMFTVPTLAPWPRRVAVAGETRRVGRVVIEDRQ